MGFAGTQRAALDHTVRLWNARTGQQLRSFAPEPLTVLS